MRTADSVTSMRATPPETDATLCAAVTSSPSARALTDSFPSAALSVRFISPVETNRLFHESPSLRVIVIGISAGSLAMTPGVAGGAPADEGAVPVVAHPDSRTVKRAPESAGNRRTQDAERLMGTSSTAGLTA